MSAVAVMVVLGSALMGQGQLTSRGEILGANGMVAPGTGGNTWGNTSAIDFPFLTDDGVVFFRGRLTLGGTVTTLNDRGIFFGRNSNDLQLLVRNEDPAPGIPGATMRVSLVRVSSNGFVLVPTTLPGTGFTTADDTMLMYGTGGGLTIALREGQAAPGTLGALIGGSLGSLTTQTTGLNAQGAILYNATLTGGDVVGTTNNTALYTGIPGNLQIVMRKGEALFGATVTGVTTSGFISYFNDAGQALFDVALSTTLGVTPATTQNDKLLMRYTPGVGNELIVREGDFAPGTAGAQFLNSNSNSTWSMSAPANGFSPTGECALVLMMLNGDALPGVNDQGIFVGGPGSLNLVVRKGDAAPGVPGSVLGVINNASVNYSTGQLLFQAQLVGGGVTTANDSAIFSGPIGNLQIVAREGDVAPGTGGLTFNDVLSYSENMNSRGDVLFSNPLLPGSITHHFAWSPTQGLRFLMRSGDTHVVAGVSKTVGSLGLQQFNVGSGNPLSFNGAGDYVYKVNYSDSTSAIVRSHIGSLTSMGSVISESLGGVHTMFLEAGAANAGWTYILAGTASGTMPGIPVGPFVVPLNVDPLFMYMLQYPNTAPWANTLGALDAFGASVATLTLPPGLVGLSGITVNHAFAVIDPFSNVSLVSDSVRLDIIP